MKNSGIEWIGEIPNKWKVERIGTHFSMRNVKVSDSEYPPLSVTKQGILPQLDDVAKTKNNDDRRQVKAGDFVINSRSDRKQSCGVSPLDGSVSLINTVLIHRGNILPCYTKYLLKNYAFAEEFYRWGTGIVADLWSTKWESMKRIMIPVPDKGEQQKIAEILDEKCGKIDKLIENEQKQIEKMKEYKQSVITSAVTKGLDKSAPLKDSGIEYFEMIPAIWETAKTLNVLETPITDGPHTTPNLYEDGIPFISAEAIKNGKINFELKRGYISQEFYDECCLKYIPKLHDIYMIKSGATTGNVACVETEEIFTIWSPLAVFRCNEKLMKYRYLYYFLQSKPYQQQIQLKWSFGTQQNIGMRVLETLKLLIPPIEEQKEIADYLDEKCGKIDEVISIKQRKIEKLQEYKKSLIYEYVTGKKEVI